MKRKINRTFIETGMVGHGLIYFVFAIVVAFGIWSIPNINKDEFPQFTIRQGVVAAIYPGATAQEIEQQVTQPLEEFLFTYSEIDKKKTRSVTEDGVAYIFAELRNEVDNKDQVWSKIKLGLNLFKLTSMPQGVLQIVVVDDFGSTSSLLLAVESPERTPRELEEFARKIARSLRTIDEMGNIKIVGKQQEEISVEIDANKLSQYGINQTALLTELNLQGFRTIGGRLKSDNLMLQIQIPYRNEYEVGEQIVFMNPLQTEHVVRLKDIATITRHYKEASKFVEYFEQEDKASCLIIDIQMLPGHNVVRFGEKVDKVLAEVLQQIPPDVHTHRITDQPKVVADSVYSFLHDLVLSMLFVIGTMLLLFPFKTAMVAGIAVPFCTCVSMGMMYAAGIELNTVTLAALIVVLGMVVDDSVVVLDGYTNTLEDRHSSWYSAAVSTYSLYVPMCVASSTIATMFFPMTKIITGTLGEFVQFFPWAILFALIASMSYALFFVPFVATRVIKFQTDDNKNLFARLQDKVFRAMQEGYEKLLAWCFKHAGLYFAGFILLLCLGGFLFSRLNIQMMPKADRESFAVEIYLTPNSDIHQTTTISDSLANILIKDKRIVSITNFVGQASPRFHTTYAPQVAKPSYAQFIVNTVSQEATIEVLEEYGIKYADYFPNAYVRFKQMDYQDVKNPFEIYIKGENFEQMAILADSVKQYMNTLPDVMWVHDDYSQSVSMLQIDLKQDEAERLGVTQTLLSLYLNTVLGGQTLSTIWEEDFAIPVILYTQGNDSLNFQDLLDLRIPTLYTWVPLRQVATITPVWRNASLTRWNGERTITVGCDMKGNTSQPVIQKTIEKWVNEHLTDLPEGVKIEYGGLTETNKSVIPEVILSIVAALFVMFLILLLYFKKIPISLLILSSASFCLFGAFFGLYLFGLDFSITAVLGVISLVGIIVRSAIIMIEYAEELRRNEHMTARDAAFQSGVRRMKPIFLSSTTTALGVIPMITAHTNLWMPLGVVICFGTLATLPLVVTILPIAYWKVYEKK